MQHIRVPSTLAAALIVACSSAAYAQSIANPAAPPPTRAVASAGEREDPHVAVKDSWLYVIGEARVYLNRAQNDIGRKEYRLAATNLRKAAAMINAESDRASDDTKIKLKRDAAGLQTAANEVEAGKITDARIFDQLTQARADLDQHHYAKAAEAWATKEYAAAGYSLAAAARYVENGFTSLQQKVPADVRAGASYAGKLTRNSASTAESEFDTARNAVGREIKRLDKAIEAKKTSWPRKSPFDQGA